MQLSLTGKETIMEAIDLLTDNAKNLTCIVREVLYATERVIIKLPVTELNKLNLLHQPTPDFSSTPHLGRANACKIEDIYIVV